jgi:hypothetical protein
VVDLSEDRAGNVEDSLGRDNFPQLVLFECGMPALQGAGEPPIRSPWLLGTNSGTGCSAVSMWPLRSALFPTAVTKLLPSFDPPEHASAEEALTR